MMEQIKMRGIFFVVCLLCVQCTRITNGWAEEQSQSTENSQKFPKRYIKDYINGEPQYGEFTEEMHRKYIETLKESFAAYYGHVVIEGKVVGDEGVPLRDVLLSKRGAILDIKEPIRMDKLSQDIKGDEKINGDIRFEYKDLGWLELRFMKKGYHSSKRKYDFVKPNSDVEIKDGTQYYKNQVYVLRKYKNVTQLKGYEISFKPSFDGAVDVWNLQEQPIDSTGYVKLKREMNIQEIHYPAVYINIKKLENQARQAEFVIADKSGGGFVVDENADPPILSTDRLREMMEAPESGYVSSVLIPPQSEKRELYFYFKINGHYGRGRLFSAYFDKEGFNARVELHIQPDGTRNLETQ